MERKDAAARIASARRPRGLTRRHGGAPALRTARPRSRESARSANSDCSRRATPGRAAVACAVSVERGDRGRAARRARAASPSRAPASPGPRPLRSRGRRRPSPPSPRPPGRARPGPAAERLDPGARTDPRRSPGGANESATTAPRRASSAATSRAISRTAARSGARPRSPRAARPRSSCGPPGSILPAPAQEPRERARCGRSSRPATARPGPGSHPARRPASRSAPAPLGPPAPISFRSRSRRRAGRVVRAAPLDQDQ